jgi:sugar-specific transcriptional regulator TrmB
VEENFMLSMHSDIILQLSHFGLSKTDAEVYLAILRMGCVTAREVSKTLEIHRGVIYQSITNLRNQGMVNTTFSSPSKLTASPPTEALKELVTRKKDEYITSQKLSDKILDDLEQVSKPVNPINDPLLSVIQGKHNIFSKIGGMFDVASGTVFVILPIEEVLKLYYTPIPEKIVKCESRGVKVKLLTEVPSESEIGFLKRIGVKNIRFKKNLKKCRMIVENNSQALISNDYERASKSTNFDESIIQTNSPDVVVNFYSLCEYIWSKATPIEKHKTKLEK